MTKEKDPRKMNHMLQDFGGGELRKIIRQAQRLQSLNTILGQCLPENLRPHCQVGLSSATELTILVDSSAWLTHLRFQKPGLIQKLKKHPQCHYLKDVQFRIQPAQTPEVKEVQSPPKNDMSAENKALLQDIAETVTNPLLKKALLKLSR